MREIKKGNDSPVERISQFEGKVFSSTAIARRRRNSEQILQNICRNNYDYFKESKM